MTLPYDELHDYERPLHSSYSDIVIPNTRHALVLLEKLGEYRERLRVAPEGTAFDETTLAEQGLGAVHAVAKLRVLQIVLDKIEHGPDTLEKPITIADVAA